jgi:hypothetical protein
VKTLTDLRYGYYVFLGMGDYHQPSNLNETWLTTWKLKKWKVFLENLLKLKANTLMVYLNGHLLPYRSCRYPGLVDSNHPNVKNEFFSEVLSLSKSYGFNTVMVLSTTGHAAKYLENNPNLSIKIRSSDVNLDKLLSPFPDHIRKKKNLAQIGSAQVGLGTLCHNNIISQEYALSLMTECLNMYPEISGVALHPPESIFSCFCEYCCKLFKAKHAKDMLEVDAECAREFFLESYLDFQKNYLQNKIKNLLPNVQLYTFTVPWLFEKSFKKIAHHISQDTIIIDWDYNLNISRINQLNTRLIDYQQYGHQVWFMPTAGFGFDVKKEIQTQANQVKVQANIALDADVSGIVHFVGPSIPMDLGKTNIYF